MCEIRCIIAGCRDFSDYSLLRDTANRIFRDRDIRNLTIISGHCSGADRLGELFASRNKLSCVKFPADWKTYGKAAGPIRNRQMAEYASQQNGMLLAFWDGKSRGTRNMIQLAEEFGLEIHVVQILEDKQK